MTFLVVQSWESEDDHRGFVWPEYDIIESMPQVQWTGLTLQTIEFEIVAHVQWDLVEQRVTDFAAAGRNHEIRTLTRADGAVRGWYVLEDMVVTGMQTAGVGWPVAVKMKCKLKEVPPPPTANAGVNSTQIPGQKNTLPTIKADPSANPPPLLPFGTITPLVPPSSVPPPVTVRSTTSPSPVANFTPGNVLPVAPSNILSITQVQ
jgi:phage protein U